MTIPAGSLTASVTIDPTSDSVFENNETVMATIASASSNSVALSSTGGPATGTIVDDDGPPTFLIDNVKVNEDDGTITFTVTKAGVTALTTSVDYTVNPNSAVTPGDYTEGTSALTGTLTFAPGTTTQTITLNIANDTIFELSENFTVDLTNPINATISDIQGVGTIVDNDQPTVSVAVAPSSVAEDGTPNLVYTFTLSNPSAYDTTVNYSLSGSAANGTDYTGSALTGTVTIPAGSLTASVTIDPTSDSVFENNETVVATITGASSNSVALSSTGGPATGTIVDNDQPTVSIAVNPASLGEDAAGVMTYTVTLSNASAFDTTVTYNLTGTAGTGDYTTTATGTLVIAAGSLTGSFTVDPTSDTTFENAETVIATIATATSNAAALTVTTPSATGTIVDNDQPTVSIAVNPASLGEDAAGVMTYTVTLSNASAFDTTVTYNLTGTASTGDYTTTATGTLVIAAGSLTGSFTVDPTSDTTFENAETVIATIATATSNAAALTVTTPSATGTIVDNDQPTVSIAVNPASLGEDAAGVMTYTVTLSNASAFDTTVTYNLTGTAGTGDYTTTATGTLVIAAGSLTGSFTVDPTSGHHL